MIHFGSKFGRWTVTNNIPSRDKKNCFYECRCECGTVRFVRPSSLINATSLSCGCTTRQTNKILNTKHGFYYHPLYHTWQGMMHRCYNSKDPRYKHYGGRGISVCDYWHNVANFIHDNESLNYQGKTIDRIDNNAGYSPDNCRWITMKEQCLNRRSNILITYKDVTQTLCEWSKSLGLGYMFLYQRIRKQHLSVEEAFTKPHRVKSLR